MFGEKEKQVVYLGSDHAGFQSKIELNKYLKEQGYEVTDLGCFNEDPCDYPDIAREVAEKVAEREGSFGILICGTGEGMIMTANKIPGIRAALGATSQLAEMSRKHNDANILGLGARTTSSDDMKKIALKFLTTAFENEERHIRRVKKIESRD